MYPESSAPAPRATARFVPLGPIVGAQMSSRWRSFERTALASTCALIVLGMYASHFVLLRTRTFDPDEFQHLHAAFAMSQGLVPFRDFFEHHMPAIQMMLAPVMWRFDVAHSADAAIGFMFVARLLMALFAGAAVVLTAGLGRQRAGDEVGWIAAALLSCSIVFLGRTLEIRPDTPSLPLWIAALLALSRGVGGEEYASSRGAWFGVSGICFGTALALNQKLLLAMPGLAIWFVAYMFDASPRTGRGRFLNVVRFASAAALPLLLLAAWFWRHQALAAMFRGTLLDNLGWPREMDASSTLAWMALRDPVVSSLRVAGFVRQGMITLRVRRADADAALWLSGVSLLVLLFLTPTPFPQYLLLVLPIAAIFGAQLLWTIVRSPSRAWPPDGRLIDGVLIWGSFVSALGVSLAIAKPVYIHPLVYPAIAFCAIAVAALCARRRLPALAVVVVVAAGAIYPGQQLRWMLGLSNADQITTMRALHAATSPETTVLDGFTGMAWFRPSAAYYGFLHPGVRAFLTADQKSAIVRQLTDCVAAPAVIILDSNLRGLSPDVAPTVERAYRPGPVPGTWVRVGRWPAEPCPGGR